MNDQKIFARSGKFLMLALDHRGSFNKLASPDGHASKADIIRLKTQIISSAYDACSGILVDPDFGLKAYTTYYETYAIPSPKPYLLCIEKSGYTDKDEERLTVLEYRASDLKAMGASGVKILLYFHPDARTAPQQLETAKTVLSQCREAGLPLFLEIVVYPLKDKPFAKQELVPKSVEIFLSHDIRADVFKLEYPGDEAACAKITQLLGEIPWILLTQGDPYETFTQNLKKAAGHGAVGFLAGRSLWQEFVSIPIEKREEFFSTVAKRRFEEIVSIVLSG